MNRKLLIIMPALVVFFAFLALSGYLLEHGHHHEDAYILFIYAEHFADGGGIRYFENGPPAEGATDFLWMIIIGVLCWLGMPAAWAAATLNAFGLAGIALLIQKTALQYHRGAGAYWIGWAFAALLLVSPLSTASFSGFSTAFYAALTGVLFYWFVFQEPRQFVFVPWLGLLLGLVRPDGVILGVGYALAGLMRVSGTHHLTPFLRHALAAGLVGLGYFLWRYHYFGELLPLPLYVKSVGDGQLPGMVQNLSWASKLLVPGLLAMALLLVDRSNLWRYVGAYAPPGLLLIALAFATQSQNVATRFQAPATVVLYLGAAALFAVLFHRFSGTRYRVLVATGLALFATDTISDYQADARRQAEYLLAKEYINYFPYYLNDQVRPETRVALTEAGRMAYWLKGEKYDLVGLNTAETAIEKVSVDYMKRISPDLIFIHTAGTIDPGHCKNGYYCEIDPRRLQALRTGQRLANKDWWNVQNGVFRAPLVTYRYLSEHADEYRVVLVYYAGRYSHLHAVRKASTIEWQAFLKALERSFSKEARLSYAEMFRRAGDNVRR